MMHHTFFIPLTGFNSESSIASKSFTCDAAAESLREPSLRRTVAGRGASIYVWRVSGVASRGLLDDDRIALGAHFEAVI